MKREIARALGVAEAARIGRIQEVWSGYGEVARYRLQGAAYEQVVAKIIRPDKGKGRSHQRKLRSYEVELNFYREYAKRCDSECRIARMLHGEKLDQGWLFVFEDLDAAGFSRRSLSPRWNELEACLRWLAHFHARFLGHKPQGLWKRGCYWHLATRPEEHRNMAAGPLRDAAARIDQVLAEAHFKTLVHGDAKPENFCFQPRGGAVAAVDFQYVGGGVGVQDLVYLLTGEDEGSFNQGVERYFELLREALPADFAKAALEEEWRGLIPWAWADFQRFLAGWEPRWRLRRHEQGMTEQVLAQIPAKKINKKTKKKQSGRGRRGR